MVPERQAVNPLFCNPFHDHAGDGRGAGMRGEGSRSVRAERPGTRSLPPPTRAPLPSLPCAGGKGPRWELQNSPAQARMWQQKRLCQIRS